MVRSGRRIELRGKSFFRNDDVRWRPDVLYQEWMGQRETSRRPVPCRLRKKRCHKVAYAQHVEHTDRRVHSMVETLSLDVFEERYNAALLVARNSKVCTALQLHSTASSHPPPPPTQPYTDTTRLPFRPPRYHGQQKRSKSQRKLTGSPPFWTN